MTTLTILGSIILGMLLIVVIYFLLVVFGSIIPVNRNYKNQIEGVEVAVSSNGIHADFVIPAINAYFDWSKIINSDDYKIPLNKDNYLSFGWGDRGVYLEVPTWADLTAKVVAKAVFLPSPSCMHVTSYQDFPKQMKYFEKIVLTPEQYLNLCKYISSYFKVDKGKIKIIPGVGYTENDQFYEAMGAYHAFNTCNYWINRGLNKIGVRTTLWSPLDRGIFYQLDKIKMDY